MNEHTATLPNGRTATRNSKTRTYTHAVAIYSVAYGDTEPSWGVITWCGSYDLARKQAASWTKRSFVESVEIVTATLL